MSPQLSRSLGYALLVATAGIFLSTATLDSGYNFDQQRLIRGQRQIVEGLQITQPDHTWNGMAYLPGMIVSAGYLVPLLPRVVSELAHNPSVPLDASRSPTLYRWQRDMFRRIGTEQYKIEMRRVFLLLTLPCLLWVFLTVLRIFPGRHLTAAAAAALVGLSWETSMHARWTEVDGPMMQLVALSMYLVSCALTVRTRSSGPLLAMGLGAAAGGVLACKVSGVWIVLPAAAALLQMRFWNGFQNRLLLALAFGAALVCVFATLSPAAFTDPIGVLNHGFFQVRDYRSIREDYPVYVSPPFEHLAVALQWLLTAMPSSQTGFSVVLSLFSVGGLVVLARSRTRFLCTAGIYPLLVLLFMIRMPLFQLRNYLQLIPFVSVAFAAGLLWLFQSRAPRWSKLTSIIAVVVIFLFNAGWLVHADQEMQTTTRDTILEDVKTYLSDAPEDHWVSMRLHKQLEDHLAQRFSCERGPEEVGSAKGKVLMYYMDHSAWRWRAASPGLVERFFSSPEANFAWLTLWKGKMEQHRIVLLQQEHAQSMNVNLRSFLHCRLK